MSLPATLSLIILPLVFLAVYLGVREYGHQTSTALDRRESIATLGASLIHEKLDGMIDIGLLLASRPLVYQNAEKGKYDAVVKNLEEIPQVFPYIDSVVIFDKEGVLKATIPPMPEVTGKSFAHRDYYQGVSKEWKPYVSEAFKRAVEPRYNVVSIAVPIKSPDQKVLGVLLLTIKIDAIAGWSKELDVGNGGFVHVVDKKGQMVADPHIKPEEDLVDHSLVTVTQKLLKGERGVEVLFDSIENEEYVTAYAPVKDYGFGVAINQPARIAFAERKNQVIEYAFFWTLIIFAAGLSSYRMLKSGDMMRVQRDHERTLIESIGDGVVSIDRDWHITLWNKAASAITGWSKEEALGQPFRTIVKFIRERDRKENIAFIEDAIIMKAPSRMENGTLLVKKDGSEIAVDDSAAPLVGMSGEVEGAIIVFHDATKEHESMHLKSDFMYASHQLRTPVTEALWNLEVAIDEQDPEKRKEDLRIVHHSLLSIKKLSEHLVSVSEIDQGNVSVKMLSVKFIDILTEIQSKIEATAKMRDVTLSIAPVSPLIAINTDKKLLSRALFEIVENAVNYSRRGATVDVAASLQEKNILIEVADTGVGIPEEEQVTTFTKFFRGSNRGSEGAAGDGLGLYLAKEYIALLCGKVWFESEEGKGTTFFISLPVA